MVNLFVIRQISLIFQKFFFLFLVTLDHRADARGAIVRAAAAAAASAATSTAAVAAPVGVSGCGIGRRRWWGLVHEAPQAEIDGGLKYSINKKTYGIF